MLLNLAVGLPVMLLCLTIQTSATFWSVLYYLRISNKPSSRKGFIAGIRPLLNVMLIMMLGNFVQITIWGITFMLLGEFTNIYEAVYHSGVNFTSLGYGDFVMSDQWKLLGPLEAANGILMFGITGAALMAILQQLIKTHPEFNVNQD